MTNLQGLFKPAYAVVSHRFWCNERSRYGGTQEVGNTTFTLGVRWAKSPAKCFQAHLVTASRRWAVHPSHYASRGTPQELLLWCHSQGEHFFGFSPLNFPKWTTVPQYFPTQHWKQEEPVLRFLLSEFTTRISDRFRGAFLNSLTNSSFQARFGNLNSRAARLTWG